MSALALAAPFHLVEFTPLPATGPGTGVRAVPGYGLVQAAFLNFSSPEDAEAALASLGPTLNLGWSMDWVQCHHWMTVQVQVVVSQCTLTSFSCDHWHWQMDGYFLSAGIANPVWVVIHVQSRLGVHEQPQ